MAASKLKLSSELEAPFPKKNYTVSLAGDSHEDALKYFEILKKQSSTITMPAMLLMMVERFMEEDKHFQRIKKTVSLSGDYSGAGKKSGSTNSDSQGDCVTDEEGTSTGRTFGQQTFA